MSLSKLVISASNLLACRVILTFSVSIELSQSLDLILILCFLLLNLADFKHQVINVLSHLVALVGFLSDVSLKTRDINFLASNLVAGSAQVLLDVSDNSRLLIEKESKVIHLLLEANNGNLV